MDNLLLYCTIAYADDATNQSPGRLVGTLVTFNEKASDRPDVYLPGSLRWPDGGFPLNESHDRRQIITRIEPYRDGDALRVDKMLPPTGRGRDAATMVKDGTFKALSIEVETASIVSRIVDGVRHISDAFMSGAALVTDGAFTGSVVEVHNRRVALPDNRRLLLCL